MTSNIPTILRKCYLSFVYLENDWNVLCWMWKYSLSCIFLGLMSLCRWSGRIFSSNRIWLNSCTRCINYYCITAEHLEPRWGVIMCKSALWACKNTHKICVCWVNNAETHRYRSSLRVGCGKACCGCKQKLLFESGPLVTPQDQSPLAPSPGAEMASD